MRELGPLVPTDTAQICRSAVRSRLHFLALAATTIFLILPRASRAEVTAEIVALGDAGRVFIGQPIYADARYGNDTASPFRLPAGTTADRWEFREGAGAIQACSPRIRIPGGSVGGSAEPVVFLEPRQSRAEREITLDSLCANLPRRAGKISIRVRLEGIGQSAASSWRSLDLVTPTGKEADAIAAAPHAHDDLEGFLKRFGDTAVAAPLLRDLNEIEAREDWTSKRSFDDRVRAVSANVRWMRSANEWRLRTTDGFLRRHPDSYFSTELSMELAAMYAAQGDTSGVERMAQALSRTDPAQAAQVRYTADRMKTGARSRP